MGFAVKGDGICRLRTWEMPPKVMGFAAKGDDICRQR